MNSLVKNYQKKEGGNVLFIILVAVALFAALSYAVTNSSNMGNSNKAQSSELSLQASQILQFFSLLKQNLIRLQARGCEITEISFERSPFDGSDTDYTNPNSPTDFSCHMFHPNGANVGQWSAKPYQNLDLIFPAYREPRYSAAWYVENIGVDPAPDLLILIGIVNENLCLHLNEKLGVNNPGGNMPKKGGSNIQTPFAGTIDETVPTFRNWASGDLEPGHHTACVNYEDRNPTNGMQIIYKVLYSQ